MKKLPMSKEARAFRKAVREAVRSVKGKPNPLPEYSPGYWEEHYSDGRQYSYWPEVPK